MLPTISCISFVPALQLSLAPNQAPPIILIFNRDASPFKIPNFTQN
uniref:Uncharacterized protein n=1 Tax=virus sp. ctkyY8 TaxID=2827995 RepID=A0A8S5REK7_9VIRU|nr:MAG TPA: hypothetical protein [virus sp. ctkyY8]